MGKALGDIRLLLDPGRGDSIQGRMQEAIAKATGTDGALVQAVKGVVSEAVKPLAERVDGLAKEIRGREAAEEVLQQTALKGFRYQDVVVSEVKEWATLLGGEVHAVAEENRPGDLLVEFGAGSLVGMALRIVIEIRDRQGAAGRKVISDTMGRSMAEWGATAGVYVSNTCNGLAVEIGDWAEGECERGAWVAVVGRNLTTALRFLIAMARLRDLRESTDQIDVDMVKAQIKRLRTARSRIVNVKRHASSIRGSADNIQTEVEGLWDEMRSALYAIEDAIGLAMPSESNAQSDEAA